jgi:hypothetical protein
MSQVIQYVRGRCRTCGYDTGALAERWVRRAVLGSNDDPEPTAGAPTGTVVTQGGQDEESDAIDRPPGVTQRRWIEGLAVVCVVCGEVGEQTRTRPPKNWWIPGAAAFLLMAGINSVRWLGFALDLVLMLVVTALCSIAYHLIFEWRYRFPASTSCARCGGTVLPPVFSMVELDLPCPRCQRRTFRLVDAGTSRDRASKE